MHRALGGAPVSRELPLGFCRQKPRWAAALAGCLLANAIRVRRGLASGKARLKIKCQPQRPRFSQSLHLKNKNFLGKSSAAAPKLR